MRSNDFTDNWEQRKIKDTQTILTDGNYADLYPKPTDMVNSDKGVPFLTGGNLKDGHFNLKNAKYITKEKHNQLQSGHLKEDDIVIAVRGSLGELGYVTKQNIDWNINSQLAIIRTFKEELNGNFLLYFFLSSKGKSRLLSRQTGTALKQLTLQQLKTIIIPKIQILEQQKISDILNVLDKIITLYERKIELLSQVKRYFLDNLFAEKDYPKIRFKGFTSPWEQRQLGEILKLYPFKRYIKKPQKCGNYKVIQQGSKPIVGYANGEPFKDYANVILFGDHTLSLYNPHSPFFIATDGVKILGTNQNFESNFLNAILERYKPKSEGYKRHYKILKKQKIYFPTNNDEQSNLGNFFELFDRLVTLYEDKQQHLTEIKKTFLNTMFI